MTHVLDTDHASILQYPGGGEYATVAARVRVHPQTDLALTVVSFHEQTRGANAMVTGGRTGHHVVSGFALCHRLLEFYSRWTVLPYDPAAATEFDRLRTQRVRIETNDLRIATIALSRNLVLVTRNARDFAQVPGLRTEDWTR